MGFLDKIKDFVNPGEYENDIYDDNVQEQGSAPAPNRYEDSAPSGRGQAAPSVSSSSYSRPQQRAVGDVQVVLVKPHRFEEADVAADHLKAGRSVILNLEDCDGESSRRLVDFLSGVAYANDGQVQRVATSTFIIAPRNVDMMGEMLDELESSVSYL